VTSVLISTPGSLSLNLMARFACHLSPRYHETRRPVPTVLHPGSTANEQWRLLARVTRSDVAFLQFAASGPSSVRGWRGSTCAPTVPECNEAMRPARTYTRPSTTKGSVNRDTH
jgi:hypothetical protein